MAMFTLAMEEEREEDFMVIMLALDVTKPAACLLEEGNMCLRAVAVVKVVGRSSRAEDQRMNECYPAGLIPGRVRVNFAVLWSET